MAHDVFISYATPDEASALALGEGLRAAGLTSWIAALDIAAGERWGRGITEAIRAAKVLVIVLSAEANRSEWVASEVLIAANRGLPIFAFRIDPVEPEGELLLYLAPRQWTDAFPPPLGPHVQRLAEAIQRALRGGSAPEVRGGSDVPRPGEARRTSDAAPPRGHWTTSPRVRRAAGVGVGLAVVALGFRALTANEPAAASDPAAATDPAAADANTASRSPSLPSSSGPPTRATRPSGPPPAHPSGRAYDLPELGRDAQASLVARITRLECPPGAKTSCYSEGLRSGPKRYLYAGVTLAAAQAAAYMAAGKGELLRAPLPPLPAELARCTLRTTGGRAVRSFVIPLAGDASARIGGGSVMVWGDTSATLPAGEYWVACNTGGVSYESAHLTLESPLSPAGEVPLGAGSMARVVPGYVRLDQDSTAWRVERGPGGTRVPLAASARPDAVLEVAFDLEQTSPEPYYSGRVRVMCTVGTGARTDGIQRLEATRPGVWHAVVRIPGRERWRTGDRITCSLESSPLFELTLALH